MTTYRNESWVHPDLYAAMSRISGTGLFTRVPLAKGDVVVVWGGHVFTREQIAAGEGKNHTVVAIGEGVFLASSPSESFSLDDFMNHSCQPNIGMRDEVTLITMRDIRPDEELVADYAIWLDDPNYLMKVPCNCCGEGCRGQVRGTDWRRPDVRLVNQGYFSPFLEQRIARLT